MGRAQDLRADRLLRLHSVGKPPCRAIGGGSGIFQHAAGADQNLRMSRDDRAPLLLGRGPWRSPGLVRVSGEHAGSPRANQSGWRVAQRQAFEPACQAKR